MVSKRGRQQTGGVCYLGRGDEVPASWGPNRLVSCCGRERRIDIPLSPPSPVLGEGPADCTLHLRLGGTPRSTSPYIRPAEKMKARGRAETEAQRAWVPAVREGSLEKDALLGWGPDSSGPVEVGLPRHKQLQEQNRGWGQTPNGAGLGPWRVGSAESRIVGAGRGWDPSPGGDESCGRYCTDPPGGCR